MLDYPSLKHSSKYYQAHALHTYLHSSQTSVIFGAMQSNVGNAQIYNDSEQRPSKADEKAEVQRQKSELSEGQRNAHDIHDPKDNRRLDVRAKQEMVEERQSERDERARTVTDPLEPARRNGNKPSRGAEIDAELQREDEEILRKKASA